MAVFCQLRLGAVQAVFRNDFPNGAAVVVDISDEAGAFINTDFPNGLVLVPRLVDAKTFTAGFWDALPPS